MTFNSLVAEANLESLHLLQDNAASTVVVDESGSHNGVLVGGNNTADITTPGPTSWLPSALALDGTADYINITDAAALNPSAITVGIFAKSTSTGEDGKPFSKWNGANGWLIDYRGLSTQWRFFYDTTGATVQSIVTSTGFDTNWHHVVFAGDDGDQEAYIDGVSVGTASTSGGISSSTGTPIQIGNLNSIGGNANIFSGSVAFAYLFSRRLSTTEIGEIDAGPEPVNSVAPVVSGTESVGSSLSCTSGTWGLDAPFSSGSNGTITYTYQWTRSDDGSGTNEADISGATSSSYTLVAGDSGKYIRCRVAASNDGGNDSAADTNSNFTGAISGGGGGGFQAAWATRQHAVIGGGAI